MKEKSLEVEIRLGYYSYESKSKDISLVWSGFIAYF